MRAQPALVLVIFVAACRAGIAPSVSHRWHDHEVVGGAQGELGGYLPSNGDGDNVGGFLSVATTAAVGENEGHAGWSWYLADVRYRRVLSRKPTSHTYWAVGGGFGEGSRGVVGATHAELGVESGAGAVTVDVSIRHRLHVVEDGELARVFNTIQLALTVGWTTDR